MNSFYNLPNELQTYIYELDNTYHRKYQKTVNELKTFFRDSHRFYFMDRNGSINYKYLNPFNIEQILSEYVSIEEEELEKLKYELIESYRKERFIIMNYPLSYIHIDDMVDTMEEMDNDIPILIHEDDYYFE
jgi:hypothetical protein